MSKSFLVFHYEIAGQGYIEAYPTGNEKAFGFLVRQVLSSDDCPVVDQNFAWVSAPSRNLARKAGHGNWITTQSFKSLPYRAYARSKEDRG